MADHHGGVSKEGGLDIPELLTWAAEHRTVQGFPGGDSFDGPEVLVWPADVIIPAAMENAITKENAGDVRASLIVEAANGPIWPDADEMLEQRGVTILPDILANAGGVTVSYFEWVQNKGGYYWTVDEVHSRLHEIMSREFNAVYDFMEQKGIDMRTAAYAIALNRIGEAIASQGTVRYFAGEHV